jgi:hypothetical protein
VDELEAEAVQLVKQYRLFMPAPIKGFLLKIATRLEWHYLKREMEK